MTGLPPSQADSTVPRHSMFSFLPAKAFDRNNYLCAFLMGALPPVAGSAISVILAVCFVWAIVSIALGRFEFRLGASDRMVCWAFTAFVAALFVTGLLGDNVATLPQRMIWTLPFLSLWVLIPRMRASGQIDLLQPFIIGAALGGIVALAISSVELVYQGRPASGTGNAAIFGIMSLLAGAVAALNMASRNRLLRTLAILGLLGGYGAMVLSMTRGIWIASLPVLLIVVVALWGKVSLRTTVAGALIMAAGLALVAWYAADEIFLRTAQAFAEFDRYMAGESSPNIGTRLHQWVGGLKLMAESPLYGHGIQNRSALLTAIAGEETRRVFTHFHNGFISFAVDGGVIVLGALIALMAAPVIAAARAPRGDPLYRQRLCLSLVLTITYAGVGMSQIMFKHDIMDAYFIFATLLIVSSIPARGTGHVGAAAQTEEPAPARRLSP